MSCVGRAAGSVGSGDRLGGGLQDAEGVPEGERVWLGVGLAVRVAVSEPCAEALGGGVGEIGGVPPLLLESSGEAVAEDAAGALGRGSAVPPGVGVASTDTAEAVEVGVAEGEVEGEVEQMGDAEGPEGGGEDEDESEEGGDE